MPFDSDKPNASADLAACRALLKAGSKSFHAASLLLPKRIRDPATALYAFCRLADDAVDLSLTPRQSLAAIRYRLDRSYARSPLPYPVDRAFAATVDAHAIPRAMPDALIEGFLWDVAKRQYATFDDLEAYAVRVAGTVGIMMAILMGVRKADVLARACDLGIAMQLTNIARDVGEDARAGRLYLPHDWLLEAGVDPAGFLRDPSNSLALAGVVARLLQVARDYYRRAEAGIGQLPRDCRPAIRAASFIYNSIGRQISRQRFDSVTTRAVVGTSEKLALVALALRPARASTSNLLYLPPVLSAGPLIQAAVSARSTDRPAAPSKSSQPSLVDKLVGVVEMFDRLERRSSPPASRVMAEID